MKIFTQIVKWIFIIIIGIIAYFVLFNFLGRVVFKNEYPTMFGYGYASVTEDTLNNEYKIGDLVIIKKQDNYEVGDFIIYKKSGKQVIGQIKEKTDTGYITLINSDVEQDEINRGFVKAKVDSVLRIGNFSSFITSSKGLFIMLFLFVLFMFTSKR